jgi:predicted NUDIX family NTP pyrophosphohydrolase
MKLGMAKLSAGLVVFRRVRGELEVLLVHPGGPYFRKKDQGAWSIPKGEINPAEDPLCAARREVLEETGWEPKGEYLPLGHIRQKGGKEVYAWAVEADLDPEGLRSNTFTLEWPPHSGKAVEFPEIDRATYFALGEARRRLLSAQTEFLDELERVLRQRKP